MSKVIPFDLLPQRKFTVQCPACADTRRKRETKTLTVYRDPDGFVRWECAHAGQCEWNERQFAKDPSPEEVEHIEEYMHIVPMNIANLPDEIDGHRVWWYKNTKGEVLFGTRRITGTKVFTPVIPTETGFLTSGTQWPQIKTLFGAENLPKHNRVIVVEGEKTAEAAQKMFRDSAVVTWRGGSNNISTADWQLLEGKEVWLWPDADEPGKAVMTKIGKVLPVAEYTMIYVDHLDKGADLADDLTKEQMKEAYTKSTKHRNQRQLITLEYLLEQNKRINKRLVTGWKELDENIKFPATGLVTIEARTKNGKSAISIALMQKLVESGKSVIYYSYEMPSSRVIARYLRIYKPELDLENVYQDEIIFDKQTQIETIELHDQSEQLDSMSLLQQLDSPLLAGKVVFVDYLQIVPMKGSERQVMIKNLLDRLRVLANTHGFIVFTLSQLTPDYNNPLHDAPREARDIHFSSDMVMRLWSKEQEHEHPLYDSVNGNYILHVTHNRDGESGKIFGFNFNFGVQFDFVEIGDKVKAVRRKKNEGDPQIKQLIELIAAKGNIL